MLRVFGKKAPVSALASDSRIGQFIKQANALPNPQLSSDPSGALATKGMRFFPQRFIPDAAIMQSLIWNKVGTPQRKRLWPMGLDVAAALGSQQARALLSGPLHQNAYAHYTQRLSSLQRYFTSRPAKVWQQNLYWRWLDTLRAVWGPRSAGSPAFTGTVAWKTKNLATGLGSWAELRHDTLLYAKQPYGLGAGGAAPPFRTPYVEPVPQVWARLLALTRAFKATLSAEGLLDSLRQSPFRLGPDQTKFLYPRPPKGEQGYRAAIDSFAALVALLQRTSQAELQGKQVPHADAVTLENFGPELDMIDNFFQDNGAGKTEMPEQKQVAIIADIFTEPNSGKVLEEGVGDVQRLFAVVSINGKRWLAEGGVYSYYEFHQPMSNRLTDEAWRAMRNRPPQPSWTAAYITR
jgi:hypothetical protein